MGLFQKLLGAIYPRNADTYVQAGADASPENLDVDQSVVDLLKSLNQPSTQEHRRKLAKGWGRAFYIGSAEDNIWLHGEIMRRVANRSFP
jgi:hypothetical protein